MNTLFSIYVFFISLFVSQPIQEVPVTIQATTTPTIVLEVEKPKEVQSIEVSVKTSVKPVLTQSSPIVEPKPSELIDTQVMPVNTPNTGTTGTTQTPQKMVQYEVVYQAPTTATLKMETTYEVTIGSQSCEVVKDAGNETYAFYTMNISDSIRKQGNYFEIKGTVTKDGEYVTDLGFSHTFTSNTQQILRLEAFKREGTFTYTMLAKNQNGDTLFTGNGTLELAGCN